MSTKRNRTNFVSEWFGHRVYPQVVANHQSVDDQRAERCPFLSAATGEQRSCTKATAARGVCTISSNSNKIRQDWLVCPYRALSSEIVVGAVRRLFNISTSQTPFVAPAITLTKEEVKKDLRARLDAGQHVFIYFDAKMSGELSIPSTDKSPEFAFDVTIVEITLEPTGPHIGRFGILEIQTMDFHGSYRA
ncbi:MAG: hypothetical protein ABL907_10170, partial [Hyphomicrobium sp.]